LAQPFPEDPTEIMRLAAGQWSQPVRFRETIEAMYDDGARIFVEVGPNGNLTGFVDDILQNRSYLAVPSNLPHRSGISQLHLLIGLLAAHGMPINLEPLYRGRAAKCSALEGMIEWPENRKSHEDSMFTGKKTSQNTPQIIGSRSQVNSRSQIMHHYLQTMERSLEIQREILLAFMAKTYSTAQKKK
jgi:acyl transferase domain-containing protein